MKSYGPSRTCGLLFLSAALSTGQFSIAQSRQNSSDEQQIIAAAQARASACAAGDAQKWASFVDKNFRDIEGNRTASWKDIFDECERGTRVVAGHSFERSVSGFHFQFLESVAIVDYLYESKEHFGELTLTETVRQVDTFEKRQGKWVALLAVSATVIPDPPAAAIDPAHLQDFVGEYAWVGAPMADTVCVKENHLFVQGSFEESPTELFPSSTDTFFDKGAGVSPMARVTFLRDEKGVVIGEKVYSPADGRGYSAKKVK
jgi:hypothetical protein